MSEFQISTLSLKVSRTLLKNDDALLEARRTWMFLTGAGVLDHVFDQLDSICWSFSQNLSTLRWVWRCQEPSWRLMTLCWRLGGRRGSWLGLGFMIMIWICSFDVNKLKFQVSLKSVRFELRYDEICWIGIWCPLDQIGGIWGIRGGDWEEDEIKDQPRLINTCFA